MVLRYLYLTLSCWTSLCTAGCAVGLTLANPRVKTEKEGKKVVGERVAYNYSMTETKDALVVLRQPLCRQRVRLVHVDEKRLHGFIPALIEIPLFGLGIADLVAAKVISLNMTEESDGGTAKTAEVVVCGSNAAAHNVDLLVEFPESVSVARMTTDDQGTIPFSSFEKIGKRDHQYIFFVREPGGITYVRTVERKGLLPWP